MSFHLITNYNIAIFMVGLKRVTYNTHTHTHTVFHIFQFFNNNLMLLINRWLEDHFAHVSRQIRIVLKSAKMSHQQTEKNIKRVMKRMEELQISQQSRFDELSKHQSQKFQEILEKLIGHFKSEETIKKFCEWSINKVPAALGTWKETKSEALKYVSERTHQFVQQWEDDKHEFAKAQKELIQYCCERYDVMQEEIHDVEDEAFLEDSPADVSQDEEETSRKPRKTAAPIWLRQGLASVVVGSPRVVGSWFVSKYKKVAHYKTKLQSYTDDPCAYMSRRSRKCLKVIATQDRLLPFINEQLEDAVQFRNQIKEKILKLMEGDEQLYQQLLEDKRNKAEIHEIYEPLNQQMEWLKRHLTVYNLREVRKSDFTEEELKCDENWGSIIGHGSFSTVHKGVLSREGEADVKVALKRYRDPITANNVWHFVDEEQALRYDSKISSRKKI